MGGHVGNDGAKNVPCPFLEAGCVLWLRRESITDRRDGDQQRVTGPRETGGDQQGRGVSVGTDLAEKETQYFHGSFRANKNKKSALGLKQKTLCIQNMLSPRGRGDPRGEGKTEKSRANRAALSPRPQSRLPFPSQETQEQSPAAWPPATPHTHEASGSWLQNEDGRTGLTGLL